MNILGIDFETTGFVAGKDRITEVGAMLFNWKPGCVQRILEFNSFVYDITYPAQSQEVIDVTGITDEMLKKDGKPFTDVVAELYLQLVPTPIDFIMAHNKAFDERFFKAECEKMSVRTDGFNKYFDKPWLCTLNDVEHPKKFKCRKLSHLALDYGVQVDPRTLHRAIGDVNVMVDMVEKGEFDLSRVAGRLSVKGIMVRAMVPSPYGVKGDGGKGKEAAKANGFGWDGKHWTKQIKEDELEALRKDLGYEISIIG